MPANAIKGIIDFEGPSGNNAGIFQLPVPFNTVLHSANWVAKGPDVEKMQGAIPILGTRKAAQGWEVWKYPAGHKLSGKPHSAYSSKGEYILMFRPKSISNAVNAIYGNVSKRHLVRQQTEVTPTAPNATGDESVLPHAVMQQQGIRDFGEDYTMNLPQNSEESAPQVEADPSVTGTAKTNETQQE